MLAMKAKLIKFIHSFTVPANLKKKKLNCGVARSYLTPW